VDGVDRVFVAFPASGDKTRHPGTVRRLTGWSQQGDRGDVALVELDAPAPAGVMPCQFAPVDSLQPRPGRTHYALQALGFPPGLDENGDYVELSSSSFRSLGGEWLQVDVDEAHLQQLNSGFSGAGLYVADSGLVVGMLSDAVLESERGGFIGRMLPVTTIRRYWEDADDLLPLTWLTPTARSALRAAVTGVTVTADLNRIFESAFHLVGELPELKTLWAAIRFAAESGMGGGEEQRLRIFLAKLAPFLDTGARARVVAWAQAHLPDLATEISAARPPVTAIVITLATPTRNGKTHVKITARPLVDGAWAGPGVEKLALRDQLREQAEKLITEQIAKLRFPEFRLEFAVRKHEFGLAFDEWKYREPGSAFARWTSSVPLIVRDVARMDPETTNIFREHRLQQRWAALQVTTDDRVPQVGCRPGYDSDGFHDLLEADPAIGAVVYAYSPGEDWLAVALDAGVPVMVWRRRGCAGGSGGSGGEGAAGGCGADCPARDAHATFLAAAARTLATTNPHRLPDEVARLRKEARSPVAGGDDHLGRRLTLFWDDPTRRPDPPIGGN